MFGYYWISFWYFHALHILYTYIYIWNSKLRKDLILWLSWNRIVAQMCLYIWKFESFPNAEWMPCRSWPRAHLELRFRIRSNLISSVSVRKKWFGGGGVNEGVGGWREDGAHWPNGRFNLPQRHVRTLAILFTFIYTIIIYMKAHSSVHISYLQYGW